MEIDQRIAQFRNMAEADPENDMAHFSLGAAQLQAGRLEDAANSLLRCIELNPEMSKAYQLAGQALQEAGLKEEAVAILTKGYPIAARRGDVLPKEAMATILKELGAPVPDLKPGETANADIPEGAFICAASGRPGTKMEKPPFRGRLGEHIGATISQETWRAWIGQGTKVINELRLDLSREDHQRIYDEQMIEFLGLHDWAEENLNNSNTKK